MPFYNHLKNWHGLEIQAAPINPWRKRFSFWPYFVGQEILFEIRVSKNSPVDPNDLNFHLVARLSEEEKPRIITPRLVSAVSTRDVKVFHLQKGIRVIAKGEYRFWLSDRGYIIDDEPLFAAEAVYLDSLVIPSLLVLVGPIFGFLLGLVLGLLLGG